MYLHGLSAATGSPDYTFNGQSYVVPEDDLGDGRGAVSPPTNTEIVEALYMNVLGREADVDGLAFYVNAMNGGVSTQQIEQYLQASPEYLADQSNRARWPATLQEPGYPEGSPWAAILNAWDGVPGSLITIPGSPIQGWTALAATVASVQSLGIGDTLGFGTGDIDHLVQYQYLYPNGPYYPNQPYMLAELKVTGTDEWVQPNADGTLHPISNASLMTALIEWVALVFGMYYLGALLSAYAASASVGAATGIATFSDAGFDAAAADASASVGSATGVASFSDAGFDAAAADASTDVGVGSATGDATFSDAGFDATGDTGSVSASSPTISANGSVPSGDVVSPSDAADVQGVTPSSGPSISSNGSIPSGDTVDPSNAADVQGVTPGDALAQATAASTVPATSALPSLGTIGSALSAASTAAGLIGHLTGSTATGTGATGGVVQGVSTDGGTSTGGIAVMVLIGAAALLLLKDRHVSKRT